MSLQSPAGELEHVVWWDVEVMECRKYRTTLEYRCTQSYPGRQAQLLYNAAAVPRLALSLPSRGRMAMMKTGKICGRSLRSYRIALCILSCLFTLTTIGLVACELLFDTVEYNLVAKNLVIAENSSSFQILKTDSEGKVEFYLFNLTNADEWQKNEAKPRLRTVGPYVYRRTVKKTGIRFIEAIYGQRFLEYSLSTVYHFEPNGSIGDPRKTRLTVPNFVEGVANSMIKQAGSFGTKLAWFFLRKPPIVRLTAEEIMWGYEYGSLSAGKFLGLVKDAKIGLFNRLNNSVYGPYKSDTGVTNITRLGAMVAYENKAELSKWGSVYANMLNGTADIITPPSVKMGDKRYMFSSDICRSVSFVAKKWVSAKNYPQLKLLALEMDTNVFRSADEEPDNVAFHPKVYPIDKYPPTGLLSLSPCIDFGIAGDEPLFVSLPFFNQAADELQDAVIFEGPTEPNLTIHAHIEPKTGILVGGELSFQINVFLAKGIQKTPKDIYFPLAYIRDAQHAEREAAGQLHQMAYAVPGAIRSALRALIGVSAMLVVLSLISALMLYNREYQPQDVAFEENWGYEDDFSGKTNSF
ncbi:Platelet glycoprotein 4 [Taenia crassiceps]|uniref:Platelet glycoprotein 4 n=1 Tax=Taenia crassiceps TaxID=6207 RepID=A0ABR4Q8Q3_9CEST